MIGDIIMVYVNFIEEIEKWKPIIDDNIKEIYEVSDWGRVRNKNTGYIMNPMLTHDGYYSINLQKNTGYKNNCKRRVHRLVLKAFNPLRDYKDMISHHINENKLDNILTNLRWCTIEEHKSIHSNTVNIKSGEDAPNAKHSNLVAAQICLLTKRKLNVVEILQNINLPNTRNNRNFIYSIQKGKVYKKISKAYNLPTYDLQRKYLSEDVVRTICLYFELNKSYREICELLNIQYNGRNISKLSSIKNHKTFIKITSEYNF
jgi:hypothetical protein